VVVFDDGRGRPTEIHLARQDFLLALRTHGTRRTEVPGYDESRDSFAREQKSAGNADWNSTFSRRRVSSARHSTAFSRAWNASNP
jgi:hypothetical protein